MPEPPSDSASLGVPPGNMPAAAPGAGTPPTPSAKRLRHGAMVIGAAVLVLAAVGVFLALNKPKPSTPVNPVNRNTAAVVAAAKIASPSVARQIDAPPKINDDTCRAIWSFDAGQGGTAADVSGHHNTLTLSDPKISWSGNARVGSHCLNLLKRNYAQISSPVIDTSKSFTVATWVKLNEIEKTTDGAHNQTFVSADGRQVSAFYLQLNYNGSTPGCFVFEMLPSDSVKAAPVMAASKEVATPGVWYHLAGVYNAAEKSISLYVNGSLQQSVTCPEIWHATGYTAVGRALYSGKNVNFVGGLMGETRIYARALDKNIIADLAGKPAQSAAQPVAGHQPG